MSTSTGSKVEFTAGMVDFIAAVEQVWWETGHIPTDEKISQMTNVSMNTIKSYWKNDTIRNSLMYRGVDLNPRAVNVLTIQQLDLANLLLNRADTRTLREKLKELEISSQQYHAWMRQPAFSSYITKRAEEMFKGADAEAYQALTDAVRDGDMRAIQLFFEMRGIYQPKLGIEASNIQGVLMQLIEIITRHVQDPSVLEAIANDIEGLGLGTSASPSPHLARKPQVAIEVSSVEAPFSL